MPRTAEATTAKLRAAARIVASRATNPKTLVPLAAAQKHVASEMAVTEPTARKYLQSAVEAGLLVEIKPRRDWTVMHAIPGAYEWPTLSQTVYADGNAGSYWLTTSEPVGRPPQSSLSFLMPKEQHEEITLLYKEEAEALAAKEQQKQKAEEDAERAEALRRDPEMVALLDKLAELLPNSDISALPVRNSKTVRPSLAIARKDVAAFKAFLQAAFTEEN